MFGVVALTRGGGGHGMRTEYYDECARLAQSSTVNLQHSEYRFLDP